MRAMMMAAMLTAGMCGTANAQEVVQWTAPPAASHGQFSYFPMGTPLRLMTRTELSSRDAHPGDRLYLTVAEPLVYRDQVVVPTGSIAVGEVARVERNGAMGKRGEMGVRLLYVQTPSGPIRLSGKTEGIGKGQQLLAIGGAAVIAWPMIFIHGTSARLPADTPVTAYLADDLRFLVAADAYRQTAYQPPVFVQPLPARFDPSAFSGVRP